MLTDDGHVTIDWRGISPPDGKGYGAGIKGGACNTCHDAARSNDFRADARAEARAVRRRVHARAAPRRQSARQTANSAYVLILGFGKPPTSRPAPSSSSMVSHRSPEIENGGA